MYNRMSIKRLIRRLFVSFSVLLSLGFIAMLLAYSWMVEDNVFNRLVADEAAYIERTYQQQGEVVPPRMPFMQLYPSWKALPETVQRLHQQSPNRIEFPVTDGQTLHIRTITVGDNEHILAANVARYEVSRDYLPRLLPWFMAAVVLVALAALLLARYLGKTLAAPLEDIARQVRTHSNDGALHLQHDSTVTEINYLSEVITTHYNALQQAFDRETRFTRDVSHELRSPITVLKMLQQKLDAVEGIPADVLDKHHHAVDRLQQNLHGLLALARAESLDTESLSLLAEIEHAIVNHSVIASDSDTVIDLQVPVDYRVCCNRNLLHILLTNVLDNFVYHTAEKRLTVTLDRDTLVLSNPVAHVPHEDVLAPAVKSTASQGLGQGLFLVERICSQCGWVVSVTHQSAVFSLHIHFTKPRHSVG